MMATMESEEGALDATARRGLAGVTSAESVRQAIAEFDELGRDQFLSKYGFGRSRNYFVFANGRWYDSKAIIGAAHGYEHPDLGPLAPSEFSGGESTVRQKLGSLGFDVRTDDPAQTWTPDRFLESIDRLQTSSIGGVRAPHKPLLVLLALARWQRERAVELSFREIAQPLSTAIRLFVADTVRDVDPSQPFWRLQADGIWQVDGENLPPQTSAESPSRHQLDRSNAVGGFVPGIYQLLESDADLVWNAADRVTATYFPDRQAEALAAVGFAAPSARVWWVNQGQSYAPERAGGYVWAPVVQKNGRPAQHHTNVSRLRVGDVVLSYSKKRIRSISVVRTSPERRERPSELPEIVGAGDGHFCELEYFDLADPIELSEISGRSTTDGPFDSGGGVLQGYLYRVAEEFAARLRSTFSDRWPKGSPFGSDQWNESSQREAPRSQHRSGKDDTMSQALVVYLGNASLGNRDFSLSDGKWGWKQTAPDYDEVEPGDLIVLASGYTGGNVRVAAVEFAQGSFRRVDIGRITSTIAEEATLYWPDEDEEGNVKYPHRVAFELIETRSSVTVADLDTQFGGEMGEGLRRSAIGGNGVLVKIGHDPFGNLEPVALVEVVEAFATACTAANLDYGQRHLGLVRSFVTSLATKRFVILTGLSGSGKTRLAMALGQWFGPGRSTVVPVRPDWTSPDALFGYENGLSEAVDGDHAWQVPDTLEFMLRAAADPAHPYLLILDEMNLAHVERYFADVLSGMESGEAVLPNLQRNGAGEWRPIGEQLPLPSNLFVVGTVNVDETTYMFSPKVLDRANTMEFRVETADLVGTPGPLQDVIAGPANLVASFLSISATPPDIDEAHAELGEALRELHRLLAEYSREFGHRTFSEALRFAAHYRNAGDEDLHAPLDLQVLQKVLPKFHGSVREISEPLTAVAAWAFAGPGQPSPANFDPLTPPQGQQPALPQSFDKAARMTRRLRANHFVSFTE